MNTIWIILGSQSNADKLTPAGALIALIIVAAVIGLPIAYLVVRGFIEDVKDGRYARRTVKGGTK